MGGDGHGDARDGGGSRAARRAAARARRREVRRRRAVALVAVAAVVVIAVAAFGSASGGRRSPRSAAASARTGASSATGALTSAAHTSVAHTSDAGVARRDVPSPGTLPQTHAYPSGTSGQFRSLMGSLWAGVAHDSLARALPAFFPEKAYLQLKSIADAGADWTGRLEHDYGLDLSAVHALLGRGASGARLVSVDVVSSYGHWIPPGICDNRIGYYEMPNARVVYREAGQVRSFGIASMISWRGVWYVVHLGAILRSTDTGTVDAPAAGPGVSAYSGTC